MLRVAILFAAIICSARPLPRTLYQMIQKNPGKGRALLEPTPTASGDMRRNDAPVNEMKHWQDEWVRGHVPVILEYSGREDDSEDLVWEDSHEEALQRSDSKEAEDPSNDGEASNAGLEDGRSSDARIEGPDTDDNTSLEGETTNVVEEEASIEDLNLQPDDSENEVQGKETFPVKLLLDKLLQQIAKSHPKQNVWNVMLSKLMGKEIRAILASNEETKVLDTPERIEDSMVDEKQDEDSQTGEERKGEHEGKAEGNEEMGEEQPEHKEDQENNVQVNDDLGEEQPERKEEEPEHKEEEPEHKEEEPEHKEQHESKNQANEEIDDLDEEDCDCLDEEDEDSWVDDDKEEEYATRKNKKTK